MHCFCFNYSKFSIDKNSWGIKYLIVVFHTLQLQKMSLPLVLQLVKQSVCWSIGWHTNWKPPASDSDKFYPPTPFPSSYAMISHLNFHLYFHHRQASQALLWFSINAQFAVKRLRKDICKLRSSHSSVPLSPETQNLFWNCLERGSKATPKWNFLGSLLTQNSHSKNTLRRSRSTATQGTTA